jgi:hypothetical protein
VYSLVNESNIRNLTKELLDYLVVSDAEFKPDLTAKICTLIQRFAPDKRWHIDNLIAVMSQAGPYVKEEVCRALVVLVTNAAELHAYAARRMFAAARERLDSAAPSLLTTALWTVGEFGEMLLPGGRLAGCLAAWLAGWLAAWLAARMRGWYCWWQHAAACCSPAAGHPARHPRLRRAERPCPRKVAP